MSGKPQYFLRFLWIILLPLACTAAFAQEKKPTVVNLISSSKTVGTKDKKGVDYLKVYNGVFRQDNSTLRSDSAYFYPQNNSFDAFSNVNINQGDTLNIYSDLLNYNGNNKLAKLTNNVRMVDKDATLTTDHLNYNTYTRVGTYTGGGKLVNKDNTLTSKNGYYYAFTRDSYFRYDVTLVSPDALIKTDTMRYNTGSKVAFFYGPTNIYGKDDTLYTENGRYDTQVQQAFFGKRNKYRQGTKTLNGDSLFYDRIRGYGRAVKNVTFNDREQNITLKGDLATHFKSPDRTVMTQNAYAVIITEDSAKTKTDTAKAPPDEKKGVKKAQEKEKEKLQPKDTAKTKTDTIYLTADTLETQILQLGDIRRDRETRRFAAAAAARAKAEAAQRDSLQKQNGGETAARPARRKAASAPKRPVLRTDSAAKNQPVTNPPPLPDSLRGKSPAADTVANPPERKPIVYTKNERRKLELDPPEWRVPLFALSERPVLPGAPKSEDAKRLAAAKEARRRARANADSLSVGTDLQFKPSREIAMEDTARVRIILAYHHAKIFKTDLQAKADSMFFANSDSTMRCYGKPIFWAEGSQLTADTVHFQMKNKKIDNTELWSHAFVVNVEKDSSHYNQVAGKRMKGYFLNGKLNRMYVDGNSESIYYVKDSTKYTQMNRSISSRIKVSFANNNADKITLLMKPESTIYPIDQIPKDKERLEGFLWKPEERPVSKESIIPSLGRKGTAAAAPTKKTGVKTAPPLPKKPQDLLRKAVDDAAQAAKKQTSFSIPFFMMP
ncbi:MAG: hypothetical protein INR69_16135 [Mucilaginibacter polytrichastri]|nr:hypothetical protein [Mucilaginibacter polytrichastri]